MEIVRFRHKVGAHSLNYGFGDRFNYYRLSQITLNESEITIIGRDSVENVNLSLELTKYKDYFNREMFIILELIVEKLFISGSKTVKDIDYSLELIKSQIDGEIVIRPFNEDEEIKKLLRQIEVLQNIKESKDRIKKNNDLKS